MTRPRNLDRAGRGLRRPALLILAALSAVSGCSSAPGRPGEHAPSSILDSGPTPKVTTRQAADIEYTIGRSFEAEGKPDQARSAYLAALQKDPKRADVEVRLAILDDQKGDPAGADRHFAKALKLRPDDPEISCDRAYSLYLRRRWADAEADLNRALAVDPGHARSHANLALVRARQGDPEAALGEFAKAGIDPADARSNLALVLALEGHYEEARQQYAAALRSKPGSAVAAEGLKAATIALARRDRPDPRAGDARAVASIVEDRKTGPDPALIRASTAPAR